MIEKDIYTAYYPELHEPSIPMASLLRYADWRTFFSSRGFEDEYPHILWVDNEAGAIHDEILDEVSRLMRKATDHRPQIEVMTRNYQSSYHGNFILSWLKFRDFGTVHTDLRGALAYLVTTGAVEWLRQWYGHDGIFPHVLIVDPEDGNKTGLFWQKIFDDYRPPELITNLLSDEVIMTVVVTLEHTADELLSITMRENLHEKYGRLRERAVQTYIEYRALTTFVADAMDRDVQGYFGQSLVDIYRLSLEYSELKLRVQLIQKAHNRGEMPDYKWIDAEVTHQLSHMRENLRVKERELSVVQKKVTDQADEGEILSLYSQLVSYLHPDLRFSHYEYDHEVFDSVEEAFDLKDLPRLRRAMSRIPLLDGVLHEKLESEEALENSIHTFEQIIQKYEGMINDRKRDYPFSYTEILSSEEKIKENLDSLQSQINELVEKVHGYQSIYDQLMHHNHN